MPGASNWKPYKTHVQGGLREGNFLNGQFVLLCAGPPHLADLGGGVAAANIAGSTDSGTDLVYPIGLTQNIALSQNKAVSRIFEIGSERSYFITGRSVGQLNLSRVLYHGPSLLRCLYAYYSQAGVTDESQEILELYASPTSTETISYPFTDLAGAPVGESQAQIESNYKSIKVPPGHENLFINLASDLFSQPLGLLLIFKDNNENSVGQVYLEQCYVPSHTIAVDSQGLIMQESVGVQYERLVPLPGTNVKVLNTIMDDETGASAF